MVNLHAVAAQEDAFAVGSSQGGQTLLVNSSLLTKQPKKMCNSFSVSPSVTTPYPGSSPWLREVDALKVHRLSSFTANLPPSAFQNTKFLHAFIAKFSVSEKTHTTYMRIVEGMHQHWLEHGFTKIRSLPRALFYLELEGPFAHYLFNRSLLGIATSSIGRYKPALLHALKFFSISKQLDLTF